MTLTDNYMDSGVANEALFLIISALDDNTLRAASNCITTKDAWEKLQLRYARETLINMLDTLNSLLNRKFEKEQQMGKHTAR